ncbi:MAG TPA: response regulator [Thermodesulfovibrionales bacterium]|nr:response regulator [Thermodesulfovibrionales bacterium]
MGEEPGCRAFPYGMSMTRKNILIVDDSPSMRQLVSFAVKDAGYEAILAVNGNDAMNRLTSTGIDIVITDLNMQETDGVEFIKQVRTNPFYKFTPIVMLTQESQELKRQEGKRAGASGWIVKPFTPEQLITVISKFIR